MATTAFLCVLYTWVGGGGLRRVYREYHAMFSKEIDIIDKTVITIIIAHIVHLL